MKYEGDLIITATNAGKFLELVEVTGYLEIRADAKLPVLATVGGYLEIRADANLPKLTKAHGVDGKLICTCEYGLWVSVDGYFYAGCRSKFSKEEALAHWNRKDERACKFTAAILAQK